MCDETTNGGFTSCAAVTVFAFWTLFPIEPFLAALSLHRSLQALQQGLCAQQHEASCFARDVSSKPAYVVCGAAQFGELVLARACACWSAHKCEANYSQCQQSRGQGLRHRGGHGHCCAGPWRLSHPRAADVHRLHRVLLPLLPNAEERPCCGRRQLRRRQGLPFQ